MAVLNQIPLENVSMADIRDTLNAHGGNATNVLGSFFTNYNGNSKLKPVDNPAQVTLFNVYRDSNGHIQCDTDPTISSGLMWGLKPMKQASGQTYLNTMVAAFVSNTGSAGETYGNWQVVRPKGGSGSPYRLADFRGYNPNAKFPFFMGMSGHDDSTSIEVNYFLEPTISFYVSGEPASDFGSLAKFFKNYTNLRLVVEQYNISSTSDTSWKTAVPSKVFVSPTSIDKITGWRDSIMLNVSSDMGLSSGKYAVVCVGLVQINADKTGRVTGSGMIAPIRIVPPFYRMLTIRYNQVRRCVINKFRYGVGSYASAWYNNDNLAPSSYKGTPVIHMLLYIYKTKQAIIVPTNFKIRCKAYGSFDDGTYEKTDTGFRTNSTGGTNTGTVSIPASSATNDYIEVYWEFDNLITSKGYVKGFILECSANGTEWSTFSSVSVGTEFE